MTTTYRVDSYHINVAVGDCAIHLLVATKGKAKGIVESAVLVDGGTKRSNSLLQGSVLDGSQAILPVINDIQTSTQYNFKKEKLKLESIVVTHWDEDHYGGLARDLAKAVDKGEIPWLKYDEKKKKTPLTNFYCPNSFTEGINLHGLPPKYFTVEKKSNKSIIHVNKNLGKGTPDWIPFANFFTAMDDKNDKNNIHRVLGVNFFNGKGIDKKKKPASPLELLQMNGTGGPGKPGMYCIGVCRRTFTTSPKSALYDPEPGDRKQSLHVANKSLQHENQDDEDEEGDDQTEEDVDDADDDGNGEEKNVEAEGPFGIIPENPTLTNKFSIAAVILWPPDGGKVRCSHYFAGDADEDTERKEYFSWLEKKLLNDRVTSMKVSHHGSRSSTPVRAFELKPKNIIISNPNGRFFHPSWELIFSAALYCRINKTANFSPKIYALKYPFYFKTTGTNNNQVFTVLRGRLFNPGQFAKYDPKKPSVWTKWLKEEYKKLKRKKERSELDECRDAKSDGKRNATMMTLLQTRWAESAWPGPDHSDPDGVKRPTLSMPLQDFVQCLVVVSTDDDESDGTMSFYTYRNKKLRVCFDAKSKKQAVLADDPPPGANPVGLSALDFFGGPQTTTPWILAPVDKFPGTITSGPLSFKKVKTDADLEGGMQEIILGEPAPPPGPKVYVPPDYVVEAQYNEQDKQIDSQYWDTVFVDSTPEWEPLPAVKHGFEMDTMAKVYEDDPDPPYTFANWYICCSDLTGERLKGKCGDGFSKFSNLDKHKSDWNAFVSTLRYASLSLTADPKLGHQGDLIPLDKTDLMGMFLNEAIGAVEVSMINSGPAKDGTWPGPNCGIGGFQLALSLSLVSSATEKLVFSTVDSAQLNAFDGSKPWPCGVREGQTALVLALALPAQSAASSLDKPPLVSLESLAKLVGLNSLSDNPLLPLADINFVVPRTAAEAASKRNAIWIVPQLGLKTTLRLQLDMDPGLQGDLKKHFSCIFGDSFALEKVWVMLKKRAWWGSSEEEDFLVHEQGEMALHADFVVSYTSTKIEFDAEIDIQPELVTLQLTLKKYPEATTVAMDSRAGQTVTALLAWLKTTPVLSHLVDDFEFVDWIKQIGGGGAGASSSAHTLAQASVGFDLRRVTLHLVKNPDDHSLMFQSFSLEMQLRWRFHSSDDPVNFLVSFGYTRIGTKASEGSSSLEAQLWLRPPSPFDPFAPEKMLLPDYEATEFLSPLGVSVDKWPNSLDLSNCGIFAYAPDFLPTQVTSAKLFISDSIVGFTGTMEAKKPAEGHKVPTLTLQGLGLLLTYDMKNKQPSGISAAIEFTIALHMMDRQSRESGSMDDIDSEEDDSQDKHEVERVMLIDDDDNNDDNTDKVAILSGKIMYDKGTWGLTASVESLTGAHLYQFFDKDHQDGAAELLGALEIVELKVDYTYSKEQNAKATSLFIGGELKLGPFTLDLEYKHQGGSSWHFGADLEYQKKDASDNGTEGKDMTLGELLTSITGSKPELLPDCVTDCSISLSADKEHLGIHMQPSSDSSCLIFVAYAVLGDFAVQYVRLKHSKNSRTTPGVTKTMFIVYLAPMAAATGLPSIPLVGQIPQPFDELAFVWTGDVKGATVPAQKGVTADEVIMINEVVAQIQPVTLKPLVYRSVTPKPPPAPNAVIASGQHFMLALRDNQAQTHVVLDHLFGKPKKVSNRSKRGKKKVAAGSVVVQDDKSPGQSSGMAAYSRTFGPLTIRNLGLIFTGKTLGVKIDAAVTIGPMEFDLIGCALKLDFSSGEKSNLRHLPEPKVNIDGFGVVYNRPPLDIEGMIIHKSDSTGDTYAGALTLGFTPWLFQAAGMYRSEKKPEGGEYHSFFAFCMLQGPLITLEFATISGITGGYGYNSAIRLPLAADVPLFPLLKVPDGAADGSAMAARTALFDSSFFRAQEGARWVAAGLSVSAFDMLDVQALAVITSDPGGAVRLGIYAVATLDVPRGVSRPFAHVQLAIAAVLDTAAGTLKVDGQLTPASFLLDPNCHLTGGFALYKWFAGTATASPDGGADPDAGLRGSWVFTLGGYHRAFTAPSQFPSPPRLGIAWDMGGNVSLRGEAYFAVTPNVCMAGGRWAVSMAVGALEAWFEFWADFLANLKPFRFIADGGVDVGVKYTLNLWLVTLHINIHIGATLHLEGPPIHGSVHVDFWVFGFDIPFGKSGDTSAPKLTLEKFLDLACNVKQDTTPPSSTTPGKSILIICLKRILTRNYHESGPLDPAPVDHRSMHILTAQEGLVPSGSTKTVPKPDKWLVLPTAFSFTVNTKVPVLSATVGTAYGSEDTVKAEPVKGPEGTPIYARPMGRRGLTLDSTLEVTIRASESTKLKMMQVKGFRYANDGMPRWTQNRGIISSMPQALWGDYDPAADPATTKNSPSLLNGHANTTTALLTGLVLTHPDPSTPDKDTLAQFDYRRFMAEDVDDPDGKHFFPMLEEQPGPFKPEKPADNPEKQWADVETTWGKATGSKLAVDLWGEIGAAFMGWPSTEETALSGAKPEKLIGDLKQYYPWPPMIAGEWHF